MRFFLTSDFLKSFPQSLSTLFLEMEKQGIEPSSEDHVLLRKAKPPKTVPFIPTSQQIYTSSWGKLEGVPYFKAADKI